MSLNVLKAVSLKDSQHGSIQDGEAFGAREAPWVQGILQVALRVQVAIAQSSTANFECSG